MLKADHKRLVTMNVETLRAALQTALGALDDEAILRSPRSEHCAALIQAGTHVMQQGTLDERQAAAQRVVERLFAQAGMTAVADVASMQQSERQSPVLARGLPVKSVAAVEETALEIA